VLAGNKSNESDDHRTAGTEASGGMPWKNSKKEKAVCREGMSTGTPKNPQTIGGRKIRPAGRTGKKLGTSFLRKVGGKKKG